MFVSKSVRHKFLLRLKTGGAIEVEDSRRVLRCVSSLRLGSVVNVDHVECSKPVRFIRLVDALQKECFLFHPIFAIP